MSSCASPTLTGGRRNSAASAGVVVAVGLGRVEEEEEEEAGLGFRRKLKEVALIAAVDEIGEDRLLVLVLVEGLEVRAGRRRKGSSAEGELAVDLSEGALGGSWLRVSDIDGSEGRS